jgi:hypothetical protein
MDESKNRIYCRLFEDVNLCYIESQSSEQTLLSDIQVHRNLYIFDSLKCMVLTFECWQFVKTVGGRVIHCDLLKCHILWACQDTQSWCCYTLNETN